MHWYNLSDTKNWFKGLKMCPELSYRILKIHQTPRFSSASLPACLPACLPARPPARPPARLPAVRPGSTCARAPDFSEDCYRIIRFTNLLFRRRFIHCTSLPSFILPSFPFFFYVAYRRREIWWRGFKQCVDKLLHDLLITSEDKPLGHEHI